MHAYEALYELYKIENNHSKALEYYILYDQMKDSIFSKKSNMRITDLQTHFETEKQEEENIILKKENEIRKFRQYAFAMGLLLVLVLIVILFIYQANQKKESRKKSSNF